MKTHILITGGSGFIGTNAAVYFLNKGYRVTILDNFSRKGSQVNQAWLKKQQTKNLHFITHDIRIRDQVLKKAAQSADIILHLAGQVAVTTSVLNPQEDFEINLQGTLHLLEEARLSKKKPIFLYSSTNKVYGDLDTVKVRETSDRYVFSELPYGVSEAQPLDFHSPYGCSKGSADQYVHDYFRIYGLRTIVFRQSCIYGPHQFGMEDQGWLAWFMICTLKNTPITIYGNGKQVRDVLFVDDLIHAYDLAIQSIKNTQGQIYNIGGGVKNSIAIWTEYRPLLEKLFKKKLSVKFTQSRPGDQRIFIADVRKSFKHFGWKPTITMQDGIHQLYSWLQQNIQGAPT